DDRARSLKFPREVDATALAARAVAADGRRRDVEDPVHGEPAADLGRLVAADGRPADRRPVTERTAARAAERRRVARYRGIADGRRGEGDVEAAASWCRIAGDRRAYDVEQSGVAHVYPAAEVVRIVVADRAVAHGQVAGTTDPAATLRRGVVPV